MNERGSLGCGRDHTLDTQRAHSYAYGEHSYYCSSGQELRAWLLVKISALNTSEKSENSENSESCCVGNRK